MLIVTTLIGVLAAAACHVVHEATIVRNRREFGRNSTDIIFSIAVIPSSRIPWIRRKMGDKEYGIVGLPLDSTMERRKAVAALFPEAEVLAYKTPIELPDSSGPDHPSGPYPFPYIPFPDQYPAH